MPDSWRREGMESSCPPVRRASTHHGADHRPGADDRSRSPSVRCGCAGFHGRPVRTEHSGGPCSRRCDPEGDRHAPPVRAHKPRLEPPASLCSFGVVGPWGSWAVTGISSYGPTRTAPPRTRSSSCRAPSRPIRVLFRLAAHHLAAEARLRQPPHPSGAPELAATGAGVTRLALSGLLTLLSGTGLVLIARQRPNGPGSRRT